MTTFYAICAALACVAWIAAEARIRRLEARTQRLRDRLTQTQSMINERRAVEFANSRPSFRYAADHIIDRILADIDGVA